jgi:hypothetical protein
MIKLKDLLFENATKPLTVYHGTGKSFRRFNLKKTTQGIIWFTSNKNNILSGDVGAESSGYVLTCEVTIHKPAGWKEYDKYALYELESMGYDGAILTESDGFDCFVFDPGQVKILKTEKVSNLVSEGDDGEDYRGSHTAPDKTNGAPLHDLTGVYPDDIYSNKAARYYGDMGGDANDMVSVRLMQAYRNKPNAMVKIYRAVPDINKEIDARIKYYNQLSAYVNQYRFPPIKDRVASGEFSDLGYNKEKYIAKLSKDVSDLESKKQKTIGINSGDWVTLNKNYAIDHGKSSLRGKYKIVSKSVAAKTLYTDANSVHEFGYDAS